MKKLYLFNPENDMALASGSPYYMAPASAKKMAADLAMLPAWYAEEGSEVLLADERQLEWMRKECALPLPVMGRTEVPHEGGEVVPWGWSAALVHRLGNISVKVDVEAVRRLSSRRMAVGLLPRLRGEGTMGESFWLISVDEVCTFASEHERVLLKAPWSGSGKGIQPLTGQPDDNLKGWARRIIASQGGVVGEPYYNKVEDFAMEFLSSADGGISFVGYSLFEADARGIYKENWLASDEAIEKRLSEYVSLDVLLEIRRRIEIELCLLIGGVYQGYLGVDMMIVRTEGRGYAVHPCVEVNLRMNMGVVSRLFFDRWMCPDTTGRYVIEYFPVRGEALRFHEGMREKHPLCMNEGRIRNGYLSLTPVFEDTCYQIYTII